MKEFILKVEDDYKFYIFKTRYNNTYTTLNGNSYVCREQFHRHFKGKNFIFTTNKPSSFLEFISLTEDILRLKNKSDIKSLTLLHDGNYLRTNSLYIDLSKFWLDQRARFYFFTILLRCANRYEHSGTHQMDNYLKAIKSDLFIRTLPAVARFLNGYCEFNGGRIQSWYYNFSNSNKENLESKLKRPKNRELFLPQLNNQPLFEISKRLGQPMDITVCYKVNKCKNHKSYKGIFKPKCNKGDGCVECNKKYRRYHASKGTLV